MRTGKTYEEKTLLQFELSFENSPFFRTMISDTKLAKERYATFLENLVREQEDASTTVTSRITDQMGAFAWRQDTSRENIEQKTLLKFLSHMTEKDMERYEKTGLVKRPLTPQFIVVDIDFEPAGVIEISSDKLKEFKAKDIFIFKVYRPEEYPEDFNHWEGEAEHDLV